MIYKCNVFVSEKELPNILKYCTDIQPVYKAVADSSDINYIVSRQFDLIICDNAYSEYCEHFKDKEVLTKRKFYSLVKSFHDLKIRPVRVCGNVKTIFKR